MKIFLYQDETISKLWNDRFIFWLKEYNLNYQLTSNPLLEEVNYGDFFIGRFNEKKLWIKEVYSQIDEKFSRRVWPEKILVDYYDDKFSQIRLFKDNWPIPKSCIAFDKDDIDQPFPLVCKKSNGSSSKNVKLVYDSNVEFPCILQEYIPSDKDLRLICIDEKVMGFERLAKPGDFRASGSGIIHKLDKLPMECVNLAREISKTHKFSCMCYDFIHNDKWYLLEMSYTFNPDAATKYCDFYIDDRDQIVYGKIIPQDLVWDWIFRRIKAL